MTSKSSLRDLYVDPSSAWSFLPPPSTNGSSKAASIPSNPPAAPAYQWSSRPSHNSIFDLSPDLAESSTTNVVELFKAVVAAAVLQYSSTAVGMPWEVATTLLQVQWVPRDAGEPVAGDSTSAGEEDHDDALSDSSGEGDSYFADPNATPSTRHQPTFRTDEQGYVIRRSVLEEGTRPEYIIPVGSADGPWAMMKRVARFRGEGWLALWKGLLTSTVTTVLSSTLQPLIDGFLQALFFPSLTPFHQPPLLLPVASHLITGFILSPLDLIRTRLIGIYLHPQLLIPTLVDSAIRPVIALALPGAIASWFTGPHGSPDTHPQTFVFSELLAACLGLLVTLPIETIRRRLQRASSCAPAPYNGMVDAFWHILTEERSDLPITYPQRRRRPSVSAKSQDGASKVEEVEEPYEGEGLSRNTGLGQLYRGLALRLGGSVFLFAVGLWGGGAPSDGGWTEI
ncbi:mitochondrial carrier domain-containing protein [Ephemerocybe angulata]|uniref:Mitochondrial carrier domain-containing protein n=1 Tax=Ephemerocybe angulata TaxID=980116 RepID=A0A8H6IIC5_9AGAR|nr:mitochondrial carrier domain-containing protein [Tulosesus angulatus]